MSADGTRNISDSILVLTEERLGGNSEYVTIFYSFYRSDNWLIFFSRP